VKAPAPSPAAVVTREPDAFLPVPDAALRAVVVVPARDEEALVERALRALRAQLDVPPAAFEILLMLDGCTDRTRERALAVTAAGPGPPLHLVALAPSGVGAARRAGMELACRRLLAVGGAEGLIATTDADTEVAPDWLAAQLRAVAGGAEAVGGHIALDDGGDEAGARWRERSLGRRQRALPPGEQAADHPHFSGASLAVTVDAYLRAGGLEARPALEDEAFGRALERVGVRITRPAGVRVRTSARTEGRAPRGLARDLALASWLERRSYPACPLTPKALTAVKTATVSVVVPAREVAGTIPGVVDVLVRCRAAGLVDEVLVVDAASVDGTAGAAAAHGADVVGEDELLSTFGPCRGKGDAMWRGLSATTGELVVFVDGDTPDFTPGFVTSLLAPLFADPGLQLVKGSFRRPFRIGEEVLPAGGGRVTELMARPLLNLHRPELAGFAQPLAGEIAARRTLLEALSFPVGYGVELAMLLDAADRVGAEALGQADLGVRQNRHQSLRALSAMALAVLVAAERRLRGSAAVDALAPGPLALPFDDLEVAQVAIDERPPLREVRAGRRRDALAVRETAL